MLLRAPAGSLTFAVVLLLGAAPARAQLGPSAWSFDITTTGQDVVWSSPTSVDPGASLYSTEHLVTLVEIRGTWLGIPFGPIDVTDQLPPEFAAGEAALAGPAPVTLLDQPVVYPEPPEAPALQATLSLGLDATGFGFASATDVTLGTLQVDLGFPFGVQTVTLTSVRIAGQLEIHATWFDLGQSLAGGAGEPVLVPGGSLEGGSLVTLDLQQAAPGAAAVLVVGFQALGAPFKGGTMVPDPALLFPGLVTDGTGALGLASLWPAGLPAGFALTFQYWVSDPTGPAGFASSNGVTGVTP